MGDAGALMTIDELAGQARLPVRTIREYHTLRLLPPSQRSGRVSLYGPAHVQRLDLIARLQARGYSLAGIKDLLRAWDEGSDLTALLGVGPGQAAMDETPLRLTRDELLGRLPGLTDPLLDRVGDAGLVQPSGDGFLVRSPALVALVADGSTAGIPLGEMIDLAAMLRRELTTLADQIGAQFSEQLLALLRAGRGPGDLAPLLRRGRMLLLQATASMLADRLGAALLRQSADAGTAEGAMLREAIEQVRVGAFTDSAGNIRRVRQE